MCRFLHIAAIPPASECTHSVAYSLKVSPCPAAGRTGRAGATGRATSFYTDRDSFLVAQIKRALQEQESGNATAFQTGKAARAKEKEAALEFKEKLALGSSNLVGTEGAAAVKVAEKYSHMATAQAASIGAADDAWDD